MGINQIIHDTYEEYRDRISVTPTTIGDLIKILSCFDPDLLIEHVGTEFDGDEGKFGKSSGVRLGLDHGKIMFMTTTPIEIQKRRINEKFHVCDGN